MFHQDFLRLKGLKQQLTNKIQEKITAMNQDIYIRDIIVSADDKLFSFGEYFNSSVKYETIPESERLIDCIHSLAIIATEYHQKYYSNNDSLNKITRLCLNEFFLYTNDLLDLDTFSDIVSQIELIASKQPENVHLLLSSFSVLNEDAKLLNISLYVQCGANAKIDVICKGRASPADPDYGDAISFDQQDIYDQNHCISAYVASENANVISSNSLIFVKTAGGAEYLQAIDICLDHRFLHSKSLVEKLLDSNESDNSFLMPDQVDHILTSNRIKIYENAKLSNKILHVDPRKKHRSMSVNKMSIQDIEKIKSDKYKHLIVAGNLDSFLLCHPAFGGNCKIIAIEERKLDSFRGDLKMKVNEKNQKIINHKIKTQIESGFQLKYTDDNCENTKNWCLIT